MLLLVLRSSYEKQCELHSTTCLRAVSDKSQTHRPNGGHQQSGRGHRPFRVLSQCGMGHPRRAGRETREVLFVLRGTVHRHILQHHAAPPDAVLHRQPDRALRGHILPVRARVLPAGRLQGEDLAVHHHTAVADHVLPAHIRDHTVHVAVAAAARQVPVVHHVASSPVRGRHHHYHQYTLSVSNPTINIVDVTLFAVVFFLFLSLSFGVSTLR